jgi:uncharacterized protein YvpB
MDISQLNACIPSPIEEQDRLLSGEISTIINIPTACPAAFDLTDINQFLTEATKYACVGCSFAGVKQTSSRLQDVVEDYDYKWNYDQCKLIDGYPNINGTSLKAMLQVAKNENIGLRTTTGKIRRIKEYKKIINPNDIAQMETAIFLYHAVFAAVTLSNNGWNGKVVRMPKAGEATGGHAILINGYNDKNYLCQDSMPSYHNGDIFEIPKTYVINEAWVITVDEEIIDIDTSITGWVANDIINTIKDGMITSRLNLRETPNGILIKTLSVGTKFEVMEIQNNVIGGHTWQKIKI